jgi:formate--tetrahydrofolate ligase
VPSDIEIAREAILKPIGDIAARLGIPPESVENYGRFPRFRRPRRSTSTITVG